MPLTLLCELSQEHDDPLRAVFVKLWQVYLVAEHHQPLVLAVGVTVWLHDETVRAIDDLQVSC